MVWHPGRQEMKQGKKPFLPTHFPSDKKMLYPALTHGKNLQNNCDPGNKVSCQIVQTEGKKNLFG